MSDEERDSEVIEEINTEEEIISNDQDEMEMVEETINIAKAIEKNKTPIEEQKIITQKNIQSLPQAMPPISNNLPQDIHSQTLIQPLQIGQLNQSSSNSANSKTPIKEPAAEAKSIKDCSPIKAKEETSPNNYKEKTIFTKLAEEMYNQIMKKKPNQFKEPFSYDSFIKDEYLCVYSEKFNRGNKHIIKHFIDRSTKESKKKQMGFINQKAIYSNRQRQDNLQTTSDKNILLINETKPKKKKITRSTAQFIQDQYNYNQQRETKINQLKEQKLTEVNQLLQPIPSINSHSIEISRKKEQSVGKEKVDVYSKLYQEHNRKKKMFALGAKLYSNSQKKSIKTEEVNLLVNKLYKDANDRHIKSKENEDIKQREMTERLKNDYVNDYSNNIMMNKLITQYDDVSNKLFNVKKDDNIQMDMNDFALLLFELGFTIKNYSGSKESVEKEFQLIQSAWSVLTRKKNIESNERVQSHFVLLFLLSVSNLYKGKQCKNEKKEKGQTKSKRENNNNNNSDNDNEEYRLCLLIKKKLPFLDDKVTYFEPNLGKQIYKSFRLLNDNRKNSIKQEKELISAKALTQQYTNANKNNNGTTLKQKINNSKYNQQQKYKLNEAYGMRRERTLQKLRLEQSKEELKECTFYPNKRKPLKRSISAEVSVRLYTNAKQRQNKIDYRKNNNVPILTTYSNNNDEECTFIPHLTEFNKKIFNLNPIKDDNLVSNEIERYEKARIDRKVKGYLLSQGYHSLNKLKTSEELIKDMTRNEIRRDFKFQNEKKTNKDTFDKYDLPQNTKSQQGKGTLLFTFEIKIDNNTKTLLIYQGDDIIAKANQFCKNNNLGKESKEQIITSIKEKVNQK